MQRQHPMTHIADFFSDADKENMLLLPNDLIALLEWYSGDIYGERNDLQRIILIDLKTFDTVATLLSSPRCQIFRMTCFSENYLAVVYDSDDQPDKHLLGIWDVNKILHGNLKVSAVIEIKDIYGFLEGLPNGELAIRDSLNHKIHFYDYQGHPTGSLSIGASSLETGSPHLSAVLGNYLIYLSEDNYRQIQINIIDVERKQGISSFYLPTGTRCVYHLRGIISLPDLNSIAIASYCFQKKRKLSDYFYPGLDAVEIWSLTTQKCIKQIRPVSNHFYMTALPNGNVVTLSTSGILEFWDVHEKSRVDCISLQAHPGSSWISLLSLYQCGLIVLNKRKIFYIPLPEKYLEKNKEILNIADDIVTRPYFVPEVKQIIGKYLGFFAPKKLQMAIKSNAPTHTPTGLVS